MHFLLQKTSNERPLKLKIAHLEQKLFVAQNEAKIIKREMDQLRTEKSLQLKEQVRPTSKPCFNYVRKSIQTVFLKNNRILEKHFWLLNYESLFLGPILSTTQA